MSKLKDSHAFPAGAGSTIIPGMTYREWLAGMIMANITAGGYYGKQYATIAVERADALIEKLESGHQQD